MSLIFDSFPTVQKALAFQQAVEAKFPEHRTHVWMSQGEMEKLCRRQLDFCITGLGSLSPEEAEIEADMFPWQLIPPIVLVSRAEFDDPDRESALQQMIKRETAIEQMVKKFGGVFAGT
ncbi:MAG: hypothetical protein WBQ89_08940 [Candidatus Acidiferrum sp.]